MGGVSRWALAGSMVVAAALILVFALLLALLLDLCCSLHRRRPQPPPTHLPTTTSSPSPTKHRDETREVIRASPGGTADTKKKPASRPAASLGVLRPFSAAFLFAPSKAQEWPGLIGLVCPSPLNDEESVCCGGSSNGDGSYRERFICISNPMYDGVVSREMQIGKLPFETQGTSPSSRDADGEEENECDEETATTILPS